DRLERSVRGIEVAERHAEGAEVVYEKLTLPRSEHARAECQRLGNQLRSLDEPLSPAHWVCGRVCAPLEGDGEVVEQGDREAAGLCRGALHPCEQVTECDFCVPQVPDR